MELSFNDSMSHPALSTTTDANGTYLLCLSIATCSVLVAVLKTIFNTQTIPGIRQVRGHLLFGLLPTSCRNGLVSTLELLHHAAAEQGVSYGWMGFNILAVLRDPEMIRDALSQSDHIISRTGGSRLWAPFSTLERLIGGTVFSYIGDGARLRRNAMRAEFVPAAALHDKYHEIARTADAHVEALASEYALQHRHGELERTVEDFAVDLFGRLLFGLVSTHADNDVLLPISDKIGIMCASPSHTWRHAVHSMLRLNTYTYQDPEERDTQTHFERIVQQRLAGMENATEDRKMEMTVIQRLSINTGGGRARMSLSQPAIEQARLSLFGGHHGIGLTLTWALLELSKHPEVLSRLRDEIRSKGMAAGEIPDFQTMNRKMPYLDAILYETLRLYPVVHATARALNASYTLTALDGTPVALKRGTLIYISVFLLHREKSIWGLDADQFKPGRFLSGGEPLKKNGYMPFGYGGRSCIGYQFALLATKVFLVRLLEGWDVVVEDADQVRPHLKALCEPDRKVMFGMRKVGRVDA